MMDRERNDYRVPALLHYCLEPLDLSRDDVYIDAIPRQVERLQTFVEQGGDVVIVSFSIHHLCGVC